MTATTLRSTGPLTRRMAREEPAGDWVVARVDQPDGFSDAILGGYSCDCNGRTLIQINRTMDIDSRVQIGVTCRSDGNRTYLPYRRMPWMVEDYMIHSEPWNCETCGDEIGTLHMLDGAIVGVELVCALCLKKHDIDLTLGALPPKLLRAAFGIEPPVPILSPPAYEVLRQMWECIQKQPTNSFVFRPHEVRRDSGHLHHTPTGSEFEAAVDHINQLSSANLIEDDEIISISRSGVIVCLREFGGTA